MSLELNRYNPGGQGPLEMPAIAQGLPVGELVL